MMTTPPEDTQATAGFPEYGAPGSGTPWPAAPPPGPPPRKKHRLRKVVLLCLAGFVGFIVLIAVIASLTSGTSGKPSQVAAGSTSAPASTPSSSAPAAVAPSPNGTFQGSCDYTLGDNPVGGTAVATGDIQVTNTGNIGTVDKLTITWPQEGYPPLSMTKTVKVAAGASQDVQFHRPLTSTQLDNLQNYQTGHSDTGCTYKGSMESTFGVAH